MRHLIGWSAVIAVLLGLFGLSQSGMLASLDRQLGDWRLASMSTPLSGTTVVVEIDSRSLAEVGVWPWPRSLHAQLLDRLIEAGADEVAFDIDFSSASSPEEDARFAAALEDAGGYAFLAAFSQTNADGSVAFSRPYPDFAAAADPVLVNVLLDPMTGRAHALPVAGSDAEGTIPALAVAMGRSREALPEVLEVDFSLHLPSLSRISFTDVLYGRVDPERLAGMQVIVGASAIELRDFFSVPRYGVIPGPVLQALALETLKADRILQNWGSTPGLVLAGLLAAALLLLRNRLNLPVTAAILGVAAILGEATAWLAYARADIIVNSASLHVGLLLLFGLALADNGYRHLAGRRAALARLRFLATHDAATGRLSRQGLLDQPEPLYPIAVVVVELQTTDELRALLGHELVNSLLSAFATRLDAAGFDQVARVSTASFALIRPHDGNLDQLSDTARELARTLSGAYQVEEHGLHIDVVAGYAAGAATRAELLSQAEIALIKGRSDHIRARGFTIADQEALGRRRRLDRDLRQAIRLGQLRLLYQPQVDLETRRVVGAEALIRWDHPELGTVSPAEFIPLSEETGLILDLGRWALGQACRQATAWPAPITVAVNVSPLQFQHSDVPAVVTAALKQSGLPAERLELEITEGSRITDPQRIHDLMWSLEPLGIRLSVDDFGTGYSSLSYFRDLPFHTVKVDQGFVRGRTSKSDLALLAAIVELARKMGKSTVAEGIEDEATATLLSQMGCTYGQGYHFGRPMSDADLRVLLDQDCRQAG